MSTFINIENLKNFLKEEFDGSLTKASSELNLSKATLSLLINGQRDAGAKVVRELKKYCDKHKLSINNLLFF